MKGAAQPDGVAAQAANALAVLHALASSPDTAADALALLHELQVHQVELDLQAEELRESRLDLEAALRRQAEIYDHQPVGCFCVDAQLTVREVNLQAASLLGVAREEAAGLSLDSFVHADGAQALRRLMAEGDAAACRGCALVWRRPGDGDLAVHADIGSDPAGGFFVVIAAPQAMAPTRDARSGP